MRAMIESLEIPVVHAHDPVKNPQSFMQNVKAFEGSEGVIVAWPDGHRVKVKGDWYISRHKAKDKILRENGLIELILNETIDDVKSVLDVTDRRRLEEFEREFWNGIADTTGRWQLAYKDTKSLFGSDRKAFALAPTTAVMDGNLKSAIFRAWDAPDFDWRQAVLDTVAKNIGTQTKVDAVRGLWGGARWTYGSSARDE